ncbi:hypothetical protein [Pontibacillus litoralis]|uniref:Uncharacterized protein n=1 Tax=Pontibacillus litoralis JSM 072002 TaxID=1385512 RepID=A0A0A5G585_9BACI|nr:hypothetical protein [Pontibacillus litoralis]KGX86250.1 hypothetical protein N784_05530 [Pontibacillus litoralis JSM 072002]
MENMELVLKKEGKRQLNTGIVFLALTSIIAVIFPLMDMYGFVLLVIPLLIYGVALTKSGLRDWRFAHLASVTKQVKLDREGNWPRRMYLGMSMSVRESVRLYDMNGFIYAFMEDDSKKWWRVCNVMFLSFSIPLLAPSKSGYYDAAGNRLFDFIHKGGFQPTLFIRNSNGDYVSYAKQCGKESKQTQFCLCEEDTIKWKAELDATLPKWIIYDAQGQQVLTLIEGGIPMEAADRFGSMPGFIVERTVDENQMNEQLQLFLFAFLRLRNSYR